MTNFADSEKRLTAALLRIDQALDQRPGDEAQAALAALTAENEALREKLRAAEQEAASHIAPQPDTTRDEGLRQELDALRAARDAEIAALDDIIAGLEDLLSRGQPETVVDNTPHAADAAHKEL